MSYHRAKRKGIINFFLISTLVLPVLAVFSDPYNIKSNLLFIIILCIPLFILLWVYLDTYYIIENNYLKYKSAFLKGKIPIAEIKEIQKGKTLWNGRKPALSAHGLIIIYSHNKRIYIAPDNNEKLLAELLDINNNIKVMD